MHHEAPTVHGFLRAAGDGPSGRNPRAGRQLLLTVADRAELRLAHLHAPSLMHRGDDHFRRLDEAIASAEDELCIEMYQVRRDPVGRRFCDALQAAAHRGVTVRLLLDTFGSSRIRGWVPGLRAAGVHVAWYNPWRPWSHPFQRTHRKLIVVDGRSASIGGINVAAEFSEEQLGSEAWRDLALWTGGPVVCLLRRQFAAAWRRWAGEILPPRIVPGGCDALAALGGGADGRDGHGEAYAALVDSAREEVVLATPYFMPDRRFRTALAHAVRRGVRITVVIPRLCDIGTFKHAGRRLYDDLLRAGVEVRERVDRMVHAKVALADRSVAAIGSVNLNRQSFFNNSETLLMTDATPVVSAVERIVADESARASERLRIGEWDRHPDRRRVAEALAMAVSLVF